MTSVFRTNSCREISLKIGLALALALVAGQMSVQAAAPTGPGLPIGPSTQVPDQPDAPDKANAKDEPALPNGANNEGPVIVSDEQGKPPKTKREVKRGKVKPDQFPTSPQQVVKALR